jgi:hypothetical protein
LVPPSNIVKELKGLNASVSSGKTTNSAVIKNKTGMLFPIEYKGIKIGEYVLGEIIKLSTGKIGEMYLYDSIKGFETDASKYNDYANKLLKILESVKTKLEATGWTVVINNKLNNVGGKFVPPS